MKNKVEFLFIYTSLGALLVGMLFGCLGAFQFIIPGFLKETLAFYKVRPLHVSLMVSWLFMASIGGIYYYLPELCHSKIKFSFLSWAHFFIFILTGFAILITYFYGIFGGREYWKFSPYFAIPILISWIFFGINFFGTLFKKFQVWPVYLWMWATGIFAFFITFGESYLWLLPHFQENIVRDVTVQWKSYGALVGSWNLLIYGTAIYIMEKISKDKKQALSSLTFSLYFVGITNLMFNWSHHIYIVPNNIWIRYIGFFISMTEFLILGKVIWDWKNNLSTVQKKFHFLPYRFLIASDFWILANLILAILISIPYINQFTHGTHVTVAHAMGSTIGINSMILMASIYYIFSENFEGLLDSHPRMLNMGYWMVNISLFIFWITLIVAGLIRGFQFYDSKVIDFPKMVQSIHPYLQVFFLSGLGIFVGLFMCVWPLLVCKKKGN